MSNQPIYLDCAASTPMEPEVIEFITHHFKETWGNPHSRTHEYGSKARQLIDTAREQVAAVVDAKPSEVIFTSGATESNNMVIQSLLRKVDAGERPHVLASCIEHPSVLEPLKFVGERGVDVELIDVAPSGQVNLDDFQQKLRPDTSLVSIMQINSETGIKQPLFEVSEILANHQACLHVDAAQGFGKELQTLRYSRIDLISSSSHKIYGPKGVGALVIRDSSRTRFNSYSILFGGGQEQGNRSGTAPSVLIGGFGLAAQLAVTEHNNRERYCNKFGASLFEAVQNIEHVLIGDGSHRIYSTANIAFPSLDSEAFMILVKNEISVSNGTACSSDSHKPSETLKAMGIRPSLASSAIRFSWCHMTKPIDWESLIKKLKYF